MHIGKIITAGAFLAAVCLAPPARADTIQITTGNVVLTGSFLAGEATYDLAAPGFHVTGATSDVGGTSFCFPCAGGSVPVTYGWGGDSWGSGSLTTTSTTLPQAWFGGNLHLTGTATVPANANGPFSVQFPFTVVPGSSLIAFATSARTNPMFSTDLTGSGIATLTLVNSGSTSLFNGSALRFDFSASNVTSPTPEPMSALLLGLGLIGAYRARSRLA